MAKIILGLSKTKKEKKKDMTRFFIVCICCRYRFVRPFVDIAALLSVDQNSKTTAEVGEARLPDTRIFEENGF